MQFQEAVRFFVSARQLIEKVKETRLINWKLESQISKLTAELKSVKEGKDEIHDQDTQKKLEELSEKLKETEFALKLSEERISVLETEKSSALEALKNAHREKTEVELLLKSREVDSSLQMNQTTLAINRLTSLRNQLTQLQNSSEAMEDFLTRFKSQVYSVRVSAERCGAENSNLLQQMKEKNLLIASLTADVSRLSAEVESLKSQLNLDEKLAQHSEKMFAEENRAFERLKQKIETLLCTVEGTVSTAEQSSSLFMQLRRMLNSVPSKTDPVAPSAQRSSCEDGSVEEPLITEPQECESTQIDIT